MVGVMLLAGAILADAQPTRIPRLGVVTSGRTATTPWYEAFRQGLRDRGYIEGQNLRIEYRYGEGKLDRMPALVNELVKQQVDVLFVTNQVAIRAARKATNKIPIVMITSVDPVTAGHVVSLAHPGGNLTGLSSLSRDLSPKRLELLKEILPRMTRMAILWDSEGPGPRVAFKEYEAAAQSFKLAIQSLEIRGPKPNLEDAFKAARSGRADAVIIVSNPLVGAHWQEIIDLANKNNLPSMVENLP